MKKAVCYYRTHYPEDEFGAHTLKLQQADCKEYAKKNRLKIVATFHDEDTKGTDSFDGRVVYNEMMRFIDDNDVDVVLTQHTNRMAQHVELHFLSHLRLYHRNVGYAPLDCVPQFADEEPMSIFIRDITAALNQFIEGTKATEEGRKRGAPLTEDESKELLMLNSTKKQVPAKVKTRSPRTRVAA